MICGQAEHYKRAKQSLFHNIYSFLNYWKSVYVHGNYLSCKLIDIVELSNSPFRYFNLPLKVLSGGKVCRFVTYTKGKGSGSV